MAEIEPKTREEKLWSGEDIEPVTREEMYIKHIFDNTQTIPNHPITRKEMLMEKAGEGGGGDITIKQLIATENKTYSEEDTAYSPVIVNVPDVPPVLDELTVTENGTYTPPSGTDGYDEVTVSVPLPPNAYLLKEIEDVAIASFNDGADLPMPKLKVAIEPVQEGSGEPSPTNVRPISGWTSANVSVSGKNVIPLTVDGIKAINTVGTWSGNTYTRNGVNYTLITDSDNRITSISLSGTASANGALDLYSNFASIANRYILNGCPSGGGQNTYRLTFGNYSDIGDGAILGTQTSTFYIYVGSGTNVNGKTFYPMARLATESDTTFEPYNPNSATYTIQFTDGSNPLTVYGGILDVVNGVLVVTKVKKTLTSGATKYGSNSVAYANTATDANDGAWCIANYDKSEGGSPKFKIQNGAIWWEGAFARVGISSIEEYNTWNASNSVEVCYELATPQTYQLTAQQVKSLLGVNNVWADTGETEVEYFAKEVSA